MSRKAARMLFPINLPSMITFSQVVGFLCFIFKRVKLSNKVDALKDECVLRSPEQIFLFPSEGGRGGTDVEAKLPSGFETHTCDLYPGSCIYQLWDLGEVI